MSDRFRPKEYHRPRDIGEAVGILSRFGEKARVIAGGTDLLVQKPRGIECLMDISMLGLDYIKKEKDSLCIGAATAINTVRNSPVFLSEPYRVLSEAASSLATPTVRNMATVGGNLCNASPAADLALPLMVLNAAFVAVGPKGKREIPVKDFFKGVNVTVLDQEELLTEIRIPPSTANAVACFMKLRHHQTFIDIAVVNAATLLVCKNGVCEEARVAIGSVAPTPIRAPNAEALLAGQKLHEEIIQKAAEVAAEESRPIDDHRASAEYRKRMVGVLVQRALENNWRRSGLWQRSTSASV
jgi:carbon-monoxide dehydrogenase medium subunit